MTTFVGLDLSLTSTGFSCGDVRQIISTKHKGPERLHDISTTLAEILVELDNPAVAIEGYSFASRNSQAHAIGELGGVVRLVLWNLRIPYVEIPPTCRAKFATGKGNASKGEVLSAVSAKTGLVWSGAGADDLCDAFILEEMALAKCDSPRFKWPALNLSALDKVNWEPFLKLTL
jgi:Holliday junction resolvasome RuvABC endonuclease subunit